MVFINAYSPTKKPSCWSVNSLVHSIGDWNFTNTELFLKLVGFFKHSLLFANFIPENAGFQKIYCDILTVMFLLGWNHHHQKNPPQQAILEIQCHLLLGLRGAPWPSAYPQWLLPPPVGAMKQYPMSVKSRCFKGLLHPKVSCRIGWFLMVWWLMVGVSNCLFLLIKFCSSFNHGDAHYFRYFQLSFIGFDSWSVANRKN